MAFIELYGIALLVILGCMTLLWLISLQLKNSSIVDIFWGTGFVIANWVYFVLTPDGFLLRKWLIGILVTIWGLRLSLHILRRNWGKPEDFRYQVWRREAGTRWWWLSFFRVFLLQGILMWIISAPLLAAQRGAKPTHLILFESGSSSKWSVTCSWHASKRIQPTRARSWTAASGAIPAIPTTSATQPSGGVTI
jgi:steroid 5-alpha reductase family enzyme